MNSRFGHAGTTGLTLEISVGVEVRSASRKDANGYALGGICVEAWPGASGVDSEGEFFYRPARYRCYDIVTRDFYDIEEPDIDRAALRVPESSELRSAVCHLAFGFVQRHLNRKTGRFKGMFVGEDFDAHRYMAALMKVIAGGVLEPATVERSRQREESDEW